uniref:Uncharacterized protein n=1 Tax=Ditylum brightwellii TaxID=49249 RepID=A0A7S2EIY5_9STRA
MEEFAEKIEREKVEREKVERDKQQKEVKDKEAHPVNLPNSGKKTIHDGEEDSESAPSSTQKNRRRTTRSSRDDNKETTRVISRVNKGCANDAIDDLNMNLSKKRRFDPQLNAGEKDGLDEEKYSVKKSAVNPNAPYDNWFSHITSEQHSGTSPSIGFNENVPFSTHIDENINAGVQNANGGQWGGHQDQQNHQHFRYFTANNNNMTTGVHGYGYQQHNNAESHYNEAQGNDATIRPNHDPQHLHFNFGSNGGSRDNGDYSFQHQNHDNWSHYTGHTYPHE